MTVRVAITLLGLLVGAGAHAEIAFDPAGRAITVTGFSAARPGSVTDVVAAAENAGWDCVSDDPAQQVTRINAALVVGARDGSSTWFRIGSADRPRERLVLAGSLIVQEPLPAGGHRRFSGRNTLEIGDSAHPEIRPTVAFLCEKPLEHGLAAGDGNTLRVYNATVTAQTQDAEHTASCRIATWDVELVNSTFSWIGGDMTGGLYSSLGILKGVTFEHGEVALGNGAQWAEDCTFRHLRTAVLDGGALHATLVRCRFEGNRKNFALQFGPLGITAIDCDLGPELEPGPHVSRGRAGDGPWQYPAFISLRHVRMKVEDSAGKPVEGAEVILTEAGGTAWAVSHGHARTDGSGRTPAPFAPGALLLTESACKATDDPGKPALWQFRYCLTVKAKGYHDFTTDALSPEALRVEQRAVLRPE